MSQTSETTGAKAAATHKARGAPANSRVALSRPKRRLLPPTRMAPVRGNWGEGQGPLVPALPPDLFLIAGISLSPGIVAGSGPVPPFGGAGRPAGKILEVQGSPGR